jgi:hypothetical protein
MRWPLVSAALLGVAVCAHAQTDVTLAEARASYDRAAAAYDAGRFGVAAVEFARADELVPNAQVLTLAINSSLRADDAVLGMDLVFRAESRPRDEALTNAMLAARQKLESRIGFITVECPQDRSCRAQLDRAPIVIGARRMTLVGAHDVDLTVDGKLEPHPITIAAGESVIVVPEPVVVPAAPVPAQTPPPRGLSPVWFALASSVTAVLGGFTIASAIDTANNQQA